METERDRRRFVAYHEAGHVLASLCVGKEFEYATVIADEREGSAGHIRYRTGGPQPRPGEFDFEASDDENREFAGMTRADLEGELICTLAGEAATYLLTGGRDADGSDRARSIEEGGLHGDFGSARSLIEQLFAWDEDGFNEMDALQAAMWERAVDLLRDRWDAVERVAALLQAKRRATGAEYCAAAGPTLRPPEEASSSGDRD